MSVKLRLARAGRKGQPFYRIVAANITAPRDGKFLEKVGYYNPLLDDSNEEKLVIDKERAKYWLSNGAVPSDRVAKLLIAFGVEGAEKYKVDFIKREKYYGAKKKTLEKLEAEKGKIAAEIQAKKDAKDAEKATKETAAAEVKTAEAPKAEEAPKE